MAVLAFLRVFKGTAPKAAMEAKERAAGNKRRGELLAKYEKADEVARAWRKASEELGRSRAEGTRRKVAMTGTTEKPAFPNPLQLTLGEGSTAVAHFKDADGMHGIVFACGQPPRKIGDIFPGYDGPHKPVPGEFYLRFANVASAIVVLSALTEAIDGLMRFPPKPKPEIGKDSP
jgi:hypothetical protein